METETTIRKREPTPRPETVRATILLEPDLVDWGKRQPGGLSEVVRKLLREAKRDDPLEFLRLGSPEEERADEEEWQAKFARFGDRLAQLAAEARDEDNQGLTRPLDELLDG